MTAKTEKESAVQTSAQQAEPQPAKTEKPEAHQATALPEPDEFHGRAGRYVRDPKTGVRTLRPD